MFKTGGKMKYICAWCGSKLREAEVINHESITHGICGKCKNNMRFQLGVSVQEYIEALDKPICIVDNDVTMLTANKVFQKTLGKELCNIQNLKGGDVFECAYARLPEGCGHTIHCSGCEIRRAISSTYETNQPHIAVPAVLNKTGSYSDATSKISMYISTEKVGDAVYLRIDKVNTQNNSLI